MPELNDLSLPVAVEPPTQNEDQQQRTSVEITDKHKEEFFKAFLSDQPYQEEFTMMNGGYRIVLKTLTMAENRDLLRQISYDKEQGRVGDSNEIYFSRVSHYRLALSLVSINDKPFAEDITQQSNPTDAKKGDTYLAAKADRFITWPMIKLGAIQGKLVEFDQRVMGLMDAVSKPDFWKAAA